MTMLNEVCVLLPVFARTFCLFCMFVFIYPLFWNKLHRLWCILCALCPMENLYLFDLALISIILHWIFWHPTPSSCCSCSIVFFLNCSITQHNVVIIKHQMQFGALEGCCRSPWLRLPLIYLFDYLLFLFIFVQWTDKQI